MMTRIETLLTVPEVAAATKLKPATIRKYVLNGTIPFHKVGATVRFRPSEIEHWIGGGEDGAPSGGGALLAFK